MAVDGRDHGLRTLLDGVEMRVRSLHDACDLLRRIGCLAVDADQRGQVSADAEVLLVLRCEYDHAHRGVVAQFFERRCELLHEVVGDGVVALAMHDNTSDRTLTFDIDELAHQAVKSGMPPATSTTAPVM